jgi:hypothetical protein
MKTVQIAIRDRDYAEALRDLLIADGSREVYLVECPNAALEGIIVAEPITANLSERDIHRYVAFTRNSNFGSNPLWQAGVRYVIHADCPPRLGRLAIIAAERNLSRSGSIDASRDELPPLRDAIATAVWNSPEVLNAMDVLKRRGLEVRIEIDAIVVDSVSEEWIATPAENAGASRLAPGSDDNRFLESLGIRPL